MPAFELAVALRVKRRVTPVGHAGDADTFLELAGDEWRAIIGDDPRVRLGQGFVGPLQDDFHVRFGHLGTDLPVHNEPAKAVQDRAQEAKRPADIEVGNIYMPGLMRRIGLLKAGPLFGR